MSSAHAGTGATIATARRDKTNLDGNIRFSLRFSIAPANLTGRVTASHYCSPAAEWKCVGFAGILMDAAFNGGVCMSERPMKESLIEAGHSGAAAGLVDHPVLGGDPMTIKSEIAPPLALGTNIDPVWLASYPRDVPKTIDSDSY